MFATQVPTWINIRHRKGGVQIAVSLTYLANIKNAFKAKNEQLIPIRENGCLKVDHSKPIKCLIISLSTPKRCESVQRKQSFNS